MEINNILERNFSKITDEYREFALKKDKCRNCSVYKHYEQVGQSEGNAQDPTFMFIGEALGQEEAEQVRPFIGPAGQLLRAELRKYPKTFKKTNTIITNVLACRPQNNKFPEGHENKHNKDVHICTRNWLLPEIKMLRPKVIITLGNQALKYVREDWGITANRGKWKFLYTFRAWSFATYHPSYIMRSEQDGKGYVVEQFRNDIKAIAAMWHTITGDYRLAMSDEEWKRKATLDKVHALGLAGK